MMLAVSFLFYGVLALAITLDQRSFSFVLCLQGKCAVPCCVHLAPGYGFHIDTQLYTTYQSMTIRSSLKSCRAMRLLDLLKNQRLELRAFKIEEGMA